MSSLLEKTRMLNKILQKKGTEPVAFDEICGLLSKVLECNVYVVSRKGNVIGHAFLDGFQCDIMKNKVLIDKKFSADYNDKLFKINDTISNIEYAEDCILDFERKCTFEGKKTTIVPIIGNRERLGTLIIARFYEEFVDEDLVLAEYSATIVGMEILRAKQFELEEETRKKAVVQLAIGTLSYSEFEAVGHIFDELNGQEGILVASKVADKVGITRSVIVNALKKFESAGVIESRSLGMKGTHIKILNDKLIDELKKVR
ncbi:MAG: GTP-sensing pleiotropic transcriptional regulator CodY [Clostridium sp.]|nr:GTP-sensing pleiotropic transcriptional regulator CodY [Clostridium sp.]MDY3827215.1 GTP-sensing pleiotropic transcriptional regulator CodY [Clostridium sp.]